MFYVCRVLKQILLKQYPLMYTSKYSIPLEIVSNEPNTRKSKSSIPASYPWSKAVIAILHFLWSCLVGVFYFLRSVYKLNPWIKDLPWVRISILLITAFILLGNGNHTPEPKEQVKNALLSWVFADDEPEASLVSHIPRKSKVKDVAAAEPIEKRVIAANELDPNDLSPAAPEKLKKQSVQGFIKRFSKTAKQEMKKYGIPASIKMGQAILESQSGNSRLATESLNFFGIKCKRKCASCTCRNYADDDPYDMFRVFDTAWESWRAHSELLCNPRYSKLPLYGKDYKKWAKGLKEAGYATDPTYDKKLISVIEKYNLTKLDR